MKSESDVRIRTKLRDTNPFYPLRVFRNRSPFIEDSLKSEGTVVDKVYLFG